MLFLLVTRESREKLNQLGAQLYLNFSKILQLCLEAVRDGMIHRQAEKMYKIPRKMILNKLKQRNTKKTRYLPVFSMEKDRQVEW